MSNELKCQVLSDDFPSFDLSFKIIIIGDSGVGKSCLSIKASRNYFEDFYSPTVGFEFLTFNVKVEDQNIKLQIWDTCGQEVYRSLISSFYRSASLAIIVYSIDNEESFINIDKWLNDVKSQSNPDVKIFVIGNKVDLEDKREVTYEEGENFARDNSMLFYETSAKNGNNIENMFYDSAEIIANKINEGYYDLDRENCGIKIGFYPSKTIVLDDIKLNKDENKKLCC